MKRLLLLAIVTFAALAATSMESSEFGSSRENGPSRHGPQTGQRRALLVSRLRERAVFTERRIAAQMARGVRPVRSFVLADDGKSVTVTYCDGGTNLVRVSETKAPDGRR